MAGNVLQNPFRVFHKDSSSKPLKGRSRECVLTLRGPKGHKDPNKNADEWTETPILWTEYLNDD